jgi:hypothetical protein
MSVHRPDETAEEIFPIMVATPHDRYRGLFALNARCQHRRRIHGGRRYAVDVLDWPVARRNGNERIDALPLFVKR